MPEASISGKVGRWVSTGRERAPEVLCASSEALPIYFSDWVLKPAVG